MAEGERTASFTFQVCDLSDVTDIRKEITSTDAVMRIIETVCIALRAFPDEEKPKAPDLIMAFAYLYSRAAIQSKVKLLTAQGLIGQLWVATGGAPLTRVVAAAGLSRRTPPRATRHLKVTRERRR